MSWHNPLPLRLVPTEDSESFKSMDPGTTGLPVGRQHPGAFGFKRKNHTHEGVDLYAPVGTPVFAVEAGQVVRVVPFTGEAAGSPWWLATQAVFIEGASGVVLYGEILPVVAEHDFVAAGQTIGHVTQVLARDKGRPMAMLHLELHMKGSRRAPEWHNGDACPSWLMNPTGKLMTTTGHKFTNTFNPFLHCDSAAITELIAAGMPYRTNNPFLRSRIDYLTGLPNLGSGWIGGGNTVTGIAPTENVCRHVSGLINYLGSQNALANDWEPSSVVLGPLVTGGVGVEFSLKTLKLKLNLAVHNDGLVEQSILEAEGWKESNYPVSELNHQLQQATNGSHDAK